MIDYIDDNKKSVYQILKNTNYFKDNKLPDDEQSFSASLDSDDNYAKRLYDYMATEGYDDSYDNFNKYYRRTKPTSKGTEIADVANETQPSRANTSNIAETETPTHNNTVKYAKPTNNNAHPVVQSQVKQNTQSNTATANAQHKQTSKGNKQAHNTQTENRNISDAQRRQMMIGNVAEMQQNVQNIVNFGKQRVGNMQRYGFGLGTGGVKKDGYQYNAKTRKMEQAYLTPNGTRTTSKQTAQAEVDELKKSKKQQLGLRLDEKSVNDLQKSSEGVIVELWKEAEKQYNTEIDKNNKDFAGRPWYYAEPGERTVDIATNRQKNEVSRLKNFDLKKMSDRVWAKTGENLTERCYKLLANAYKGAPGAQLYASAKAMARQLSDNAVYRYAVKKNAPKSTLDYLGKMVQENNLLNSLSVAAARTEAGTTGDLSAKEQAMNEYGEAHPWQRVAGTVLGMASDPTTYLGGYAGNLVARGTLGLTGRLLFGRLANNAGARLVGSTLGGRVLSGVAGGAGNMATYEGVKEAENQLKHGGYINPETGQNEGFSVGQMLKAAGHGAIIGSATGVVSPLLGNVADKVVKATSNTAGKVGARAGELALSTVAEGTIFATPEWIANAKLEENDPNKKSGWDIWTNSMGTMLGFKAMHAVKAAPKVIADLRPIKNPRTIQERNHNRMKFLERLRNRLNASPKDMAFTNEEREELVQNGYGGLASLFAMKEKQMRRNPAISDFNVATFENPKGVEVSDEGRAWLKNHPEIDGYDTMEEFMQDGNISQSARAKAYYIFTGRHLPMGTVMGCTKEIDENGNIYIKSITSYGEVVTNKRVANEDEAQREQDKIMRQVELNTIDVGESMAEQRADNMMWNEAVQYASPGADPETVRKNYQSALAGDENAQKQFGDIFNKIDEFYERNGNIADSQRPEFIRKEISEKTGVDVDEAIRKVPEKRTEEEQKAVQEYAERLYPENNKEAEPNDRAGIEGPEDNSHAPNENQPKEPGPTENNSQQDNAEGGFVQDEQPQPAQTAPADPVQAEYDRQKQAVSDELFTDLKDKQLVYTDPQTGQECLWKATYHGQDYYIVKQNRVQESSPSHTVSYNIYTLRDEQGGTIVINSLDLDLRFDNPVPLDQMADQALAQRGITPESIQKQIDFSQSHNPQTKVLSVGDTYTDPDGTKQIVVGEADGKLIVRSAHFDTQQQKYTEDPKSPTRELTPEQVAAEQDAYYDALDQQTPTTQTPEPEEKQETDNTPVEPEQPHYTKPSQNPEPFGPGDQLTFYIDNKPIQAEVVQPENEDGVVIETSQRVNGHKVYQYTREELDQLTTPPEAKNEEPNHNEPQQPKNTPEQTPTTQTTNNELPPYDGDKFNQTHTATETGTQQPQQVSSDANLSPQNDNKENETKPQLVSPSDTQTPQPTTGSALSRIPQDENGEPLYTQTDPKTAWNALLEQAEGDTGIAKEVATSMLSDLKAELKQSQKQKPTGGKTVSEKIQAQKEHKANIDRIQNEVDKWQEILNQGEKKEEPKENTIPTQDEAPQATVVRDEAPTPDHIADDSKKVKENTVAQNRADNQGNPLNEDGTLKVAKVKSIDEITDKDFNSPTRNVELPKLPQIVDDAIGTNGKPMVIKKNIFEKNKRGHKDLTPQQSRQILHDALFETDLYGQNQKTSRPYNWILIHNADKHSSVIVEVNHNKDNTEIVNWHYLDDVTLERKKRQAVREGGLILTLESAAADTHNGLSSESKDTTSKTEEQEKSKENKEEDAATQPRQENGAENANPEKVSPEQEAEQKAYDKWKRKDEKNLRKQAEQLYDEAFNDGYVTPEIIAAQTLASVKITPESLRAHTGFSKADQRKYVGMIAKKENGGISFDQAVEMAETAYREANNDNDNVDFYDMRSIVEDIIHEGNPRGYEKRFREQQIKQTVDALKAERDKAFDELYGTDYDTYMQNPQHREEELSYTTKSKKQSKEDTPQTPAIENDPLGPIDPDAVVPFHKTEQNNTTQLTPEETLLRDTIVERLKEAGIPVSTDTKEGQALLDLANGKGDVKLMSASERKERIEQINNITPEKVEDKPTTREKAKTAYTSLKPVKKDGTTIEFYNSAFGKAWHGNDCLFGKIIPKLREIFKSSVLAYSETDNLAGKTRPDGTIHKRHPNIKAFHNYVGKVSIGNKQYYVRFTVQEGTDTKQGTHNFFVSDIALYNNTVRNVTTDTNNTLGNTNTNGIVDAKLKNFLENTVDNTNFSYHRVYHGSGVDFEEFDHSHMGEGEGMQAFGWGTYVTEVEGIGRAYAESYVETHIDDRDEFINDMDVITDIDVMTRERFGISEPIFLENGYNAGDADKENLVKEACEYYGYDVSDYYDEDGDLDEDKADVLLDELFYDMDSDFESEFSRRKEAFMAPLQPILYTVEIPDDDGSNYLDWDGRNSDIPSQKIDAISAELEKLGWKRKDLPNAVRFTDGYDNIEITPDATGADLYEEITAASKSPKQTSKLLSRAGFVGIKYPANYTTGGNEYGTKNYVIFNEKDAKITDHIRFFRTPDGQAYGYTVGGKIYIDPTIARADTPIHEYTHLWAEALRQANHKEWENIISLMKDLPLWNEIRKRYPELKTDSEIADEVLAHYSGVRGAERLREEQEKIKNSNQNLTAKARALAAIEKVRQALNRFWKQVADFLHIHYTSAEQVADQVMKDMLNGVNPKMANKGKTLAGVHNISEDKLLKALKLGGLANPSMAVIDTAKSTHTGYGEISLIAPSSLVDKRTGKNAGTFYGDAWTPTYPTVEKYIPEQSQGLLEKDLDSLPREMYGITRNAIDSLVEGGGADGLAYMYLHERGMAPELVRLEGKYPKRLQEHVKEIIGRSTFSQLSDTDRQKIVELYIQHQYQGDRKAFLHDMSTKKQKWQDFVTSHPKSSIARDKQMDIDYISQHGYDYDTVSKFAGDVLRDTQNQGRISDSLTSQKALRDIEAKKLTQDFEQWKQELKQRYGVQERIFDGYTPSGKPKYVPNDLEHVSRKMKQQGRNGATGILPTFGSFVGSALQANGNLSNIRQNKHRLTNEHKDLEEFEEQWKPTYEHLAEVLNPKPSGTFDDTGYLRLQELANQKDPKGYVLKEYGITLTDKDVSDLNNMIKAIRDERPAMYFETKFERPVTLNEFKAAVVPNDADPRVVEGLKQSGLNIFTYDPTVKDDRQRATNQAMQSSEDIRFQKVGDVNEQFNKELDEFKNGTHKGLLHLGKPRGILKQCGITAQEMTISPTVLHKHLKKHNLTTDDLKGLAESIQQPILVYKHGRNNPNIVVVTELNVKGGKLSASFVLDESGKVVEVSNISSVHSKDATKELERLFAMGENDFKKSLKWVEKEKVLDWLAPNSYENSDMQENQAPFDIAKILNNFENPKLSEENQTDNTLFRDQEPITPSSDPKDMAETARSLGKQLGEEVELVTDPSQITDSNPVIQERKRKAKGWFDRKTGKVVVNLSTHKDTADVAETILHETVGHKGLRALVGEENFNEFLDNIYEHASNPVRQAIDNLSQRKGYSKRTATEEYMAGLAENGFNDRLNASLWHKIKQWLSDMLAKAKTKLNFNISDRELKYQLWKSYQLRRNKGKENIIDRAKDISMQAKLRVGNNSDLFRNAGGSHDTAVVITKHNETTSDSEDLDTLFRDADDPVDYERALVRDSYERRMRSAIYQMREAMQDRYLSLKKTMEDIWKASGKTFKQITDIPAYQNPYLGLVALSSVNEKEVEQFHRQLFKPLLKEMLRLAPTADDRAKLTDYMMAKHGLERNILMAERNAKIEFEQEKKRNPQTTKTLQYFIDENRKKDFSGLTALTEKNNVADAENEAKQMVTDYESKHNTSELWKLTKAVTDSIIQKQYETGYIDNNTRKQLQKMYKNYIPLRGFKDRTAEDVYSYMRHSNSGFSAPIKTARGRKSKADDPFANMVAMAESGILRGNRNQLVKLPLLNLVQEHPTDLISLSDVWLKLNHTLGEWETVAPGDVKGTKAIDEDDTPEEIERKIKTFNGIMKGLAQEHPDKYRKQADAPDIPYRVVKTSSLTEHQIIITRNGKDYTITINANPRLAQTVNGIGNPDNIDNIVKKTTRYLSQIYTQLSIDFATANFTRDTIYSNISAHIKEGRNYGLHYNINFIKNVPRMYKLYYKYKRGTLGDTGIEKKFKDFIAHGGETGYYILPDMEKRKRDIEKEIKQLNGKITPRKAFNWLKEFIDYFNKTAENTARFTAFQTSRTFGRSITHAIQNAKDISVNFNTKGAGTQFLHNKEEKRIAKAIAILAKYGQEYLPFFNAAIQGTTNFASMAKHHPKASATVITTLITLSATVALMGTTKSGDEDDDEYNYYNIPSYVRRNNITFRVGHKTYITIPLPVEYRIFYGLGELMTSSFTGAERLSSAELTKEVFSLFSQALPIDFAEEGDAVSKFLPGMIKPIWEVRENKSWTGLPIYKDNVYNKNTPEYLSVYSNTNQQLVELSKFLNDITGGDTHKRGELQINPAAVEYLLSSYLGGLYTLSNRLTKTAETITGTREFNPNSVPVINRFIKQPDERTAYRQINTEYEKIKDDAEALDALLNNYNKDTRNGVADYAKKIRTINYSPEYRYMLIYQGIQPHIEKLKKKLKDEDGQLSDKEIEALEYSIQGLKKLIVDRVRYEQDHKSSKPIVEPFLDDNFKNKWVNKHPQSKKVFNELSKEEKGNGNNLGSVYQQYASDNDRRLDIQVDRLADKLTDSQKKNEDVKNARKEYNKSIRSFNELIDNNDAKPTDYKNALQSIRTDRMEYIKAMIKAKLSSKR